MPSVVKFWYTFLASMAVLTISMFLFVQIDLFFNGGWIYPAAEHLKWYHYLTSQHAITFLYIRSWHAFLVPPAVLATIFTAWMFLQD